MERRDCSAVALARLSPSTLRIMAGSTFNAKITKTTRMAAAIFPGAGHQCASPGLAGRAAQRGPESTSARATGVSQGLAHLRSFWALGTATLETSDGNRRSSDGAQLPHGSLQRQVG